MNYHFHLLQRHYLLKTILFMMVVMHSSCLQAQFRYTNNKAIVKDSIIMSKVLGEERKISIYRPETFPEYADAVSPIIYVLDGDAYTYYLANMVNMLCERFVQMPPITVVGINNLGTNDARERDFTPLINNIGDAKNCGADKFIQYLKEEVIPFVEKRYKIKPYRVVTGHSSSSALVLHAFLKYPTLFNAYLASDPSIDDPAISDAYLNFADSVIRSLSERDNTLFLSSGGAFWAEPYARKLDSMIRMKELKNLSYQYVHYPYADHFNVFLKAYQDGFNFIFQMNFSPEIMQPSELSIQMFEEQYSRMSRIFGYKMKPRELVMDDYGLHFLGDWNDIDKALQFLKWNVDNYPESSNAYNNYAEALLKKGDKRSAIVNYEKSFQLDSTNTKARDIAQKLKNEK